MFKKISAILMVIMLSGCSFTKNQYSSDVNLVNRPVNISEQSFGEATTFRVGMLLPLSGPNAKQGQGLRNAALMALEDVKNPYMMLQFYDTKGTPSGARVAIENAMNQKAQLIIGPLMSNEVEAIADRTNSRGIPVIAFSTNSDVLRPGVYSMGLLIGEQVDRIMSYAAKEGRSRFALLIPDNNTGISVAKAAIVSARKNHVTISRIAFYPTDTTDFSEVLKDLTDYNERSGKVKAIKDALTARADQGDEEAVKELRKLKTVDTMGEIDFDAILVPEHGTKLKSAVAMLGYYDISMPQVKILGTSMWENSGLNNEGNFIGAWYPALSRSHNEYFASSYRNLFGEKPSSIYSFAYDAVALASSLSGTKDRELEGAITNPNGYVGINGAFRIFSDGTNQHSLDIVEVKNSGDVVVDEALKSFADVYYDGLGRMVIDESYIAPKIFGKDKATAQVLIYGQEIEESFMLEE